MNKSTIISTLQKKKLRFREGFAWGHMEQGRNPGLSESRALALRHTVWHRYRELLTETFQGNVQNEHWNQIPMVATGGRG